MSGALDRAAPASTTFREGAQSPSHEMRSPTSFSGLLSKEWLQLSLQGTLSGTCCCFTWACLPPQFPHTALPAAGLGPPPLFSDQPAASQRPLPAAAWAGIGAPCYRHPVKTAKEKVILFEKEGVLLPSPRLRARQMINKENYVCRKKCQESMFSKEESLQKVPKQK